MARRSRTSPLARAFQRSLGTMARATLRTAKRAVVQATKAAKTAQAKKPVKAAFGLTRAKPVPATAGGAWTTGIALAHGTARRYRLFKPVALRRGAGMPMLVMLHGCGQDAAGFARSTGLHKLAMREGFLLMFPEQERLANPQGCWNWFEMRSGRALAEAASIVAAIDQACLLHGADASRVAVAGFSAGAGMAGLLAVHEPARFAAVAMHSGVPPGAAESTPSAISAMHGRRVPVPLPPMPHLPPLLVIQGSMDHVVSAANGPYAARLWADATGAKAGPQRTVQRGQRLPMTVTDFRRSGRIAATLCEVHRLGHDWSGGAAGQAHSDPKGPDAGRMVWSFAARCFDRVLAQGKPALRKVG